MCKNKNIILHKIKKETIMCDNHKEECGCGCGHHHKHHEKKQHEDNGCGCGHCHHDRHSHGGESSGARGYVKEFAPEILSAVLMVISLVIEWHSPWVEIFAYIVSVLPVGFPILFSTFKEWAKGDIFNEFTLMIMACAGAFLIGEYAEGVAILLFYSFGEKLEEVVSGDVRSQIKNLLGKMPKSVTVEEKGHRREIRPEEVEIGATVVTKPGDSVALDGKLISTHGADFNTAAITGESMPRFIDTGGEVSAGFIPVDREVKVEVRRAYSDSSMSRIMQMIEDASSHRAPSETILRKITRWYTPIVFAAALLLFVIPWIVGLSSSSFTFEWSVWLRRSLVFLVCSCPCALIVSIPLTYFASIGIASKKGILFKGHDSLDKLRLIDTLMLDKTGTVTTGKFHVEQIVNRSGLSDESLIGIAASLERSSNHPLASAVMEYSGRQQIKLPETGDVKTERHGISGMVAGQKIVIGSDRIMKAHGIETGMNDTDATTIFIAIDGKFAGFLTLSDTLKEGAAEAVKGLHDSGVESVGIISGDIQSAVDKIKRESGSDFGMGGLLPEDKQKYISDLRKAGKRVAFAGDGINDAPALAAADAGIAMGTAGTDLAIESAQIVIAGDDLNKILEGRNISRQVKSVIIENVTFAFGVKLCVMILGAFGIASLWAAVFADTGVTVVTVLWTLYRLKIWELTKKARK